MNIGKSLKVALAQRDMKQNQLAAKLKKTPRWINDLANNETASSATIQMLAGAFDMKASDFVALGED